MCKKETLPKPTTNQPRENKLKKKKPTKTPTPTKNYFNTISMLEVLFVFTKAFNKNLSWVTVAMEEIFSS